MIGRYRIVGFSPATGSGSSSAAEPNLDVCLDVGQFRFYRLDVCLDVGQFRFHSLEFYLDAG